MLTSMEATKYLGISRPQLTLLIREGRIKGENIFSNTVYYKVSELDRLKRELEYEQAVRSSTYHPDIVNKVIL